MTSSSARQPLRHLSPAERARLNALVDRLVEARRSKAAAEAAETRVLAEALSFACERGGTDDARECDLAVREIAAELAAAVRTSDRTMQARLSEAELLTTRFPATLAALAAGEIERSHLRTIVENGARIDDDAARATFEDAALDLARRETPGRIRPVLRMLAQRIDPIPLSERHRLAKADADVWVRGLEDGMAQISALVPAHIAEGILDRLTQYAKSIIRFRGTQAGADASSPTDTDASATLDGIDTAACGAEPDTRALGEVRADVFADLLLTGHATAEISSASVPESEAITAHVQVTIPASTLTGHSDDAAELAGHGPIPAEIARRLAGTATIWMRLFTDPGTDCITDIDQYRLPPSMRRLLFARDEHCRFPGCRRPVWRCDADHTIAHEDGGPTCCCNLAHLCRGHHVVKHNCAWGVRQLPGGVLEWTSPAGRIYNDIPARTLAFTAGAVPIDQATGPPGDPPPF